VIPNHTENFVHKIFPLIKNVVKNRTNLKTYGDKFFTEKTPLDPRSPYSASKAGADHIVLAYGETYKMPITITAQPKLPLSATKPISLKN